MSACRKNPFAFLALLILALLSFPVSGYCDDSGTPPTPLEVTNKFAGDIGEVQADGVMKDADIANCHNTLVKNAASVAHERILYVDALFNSVNLRMQYCFDQIQQMFNFAGMTGDPLNLVFSAIESMIAQQIMNIANEVCSDALSVASQLKAFAMSQFNRLCIPLPNFGIGGVNLGLQGPPCNGTQLLPLNQMFSTPRPTGFDPSTIMPQGTAPTSVR